MEPSSWPALAGMVSSSCNCKWLKLSYPEVKTERVMEELDKKEHKERLGFFRSRPLGKDLHLFVLVLCYCHNHLFVPLLEKGRQGGYVNAEIFLSLQMSSALK